MNSDLLKWLPITLIAAGLVASGTTAQLQIGANAAEIEDMGESIDATEDEIEQIRRLLIQRQGETSLTVLQIQTEQKAQAKDLDQILQILQEIRRGQ